MNNYGSERRRLYSPTLGWEETAKNFPDIGLEGLKKSLKYKLE